MSIPQIKRIAFLKRILAKSNRYHDDFSPTFMPSEEETGERTHGDPLTSAHVRRAKKSFREISGISKDDLAKLLQDEDVKKHIVRMWRQDPLKEDKLTEEKLREYMEAYLDGEKIKAGLDSVDYSGTNPLFSRTSEE